MLSRPNTRTGSPHCVSSLKYSIKNHWKLMTTYKFHTQQVSSASEPWFSLLQVCGPWNSWMLIFRWLATMTAHLCHDEFHNRSPRGCNFENVTRHINSAGSCNTKTWKKNTKKKRWFRFKKSFFFKLVHAVLVGLRLYGVPVYTYCPCRSAKKTVP